MAHTCVFPTDDRGMIRDDAVCPTCGRSVMDGYALFDLTEGDHDGHRNEDDPRP